MDILKEVYTYPEGARFGIGAVDSYGAVNFKEYSRDTFGHQSHGILGNPSGRYTFRYFDGEVEWSDCPYPSDGIREIVDDYLEKRGLPVKKHTSVFMMSDPPEEERDYD